MRSFVLAPLIGLAVLVIFFTLTVTPRPGDPLVVLFPFSASQPEMMLAMEKVETDEWSFVSSGPLGNSLTIYSEHPKITDMLYAVGAFAVLNGRPMMCGARAKPSRNGFTNS